MNSLFCPDGTLVVLAKRFCRWGSFAIASWHKAVHTLQQNEGHNFGINPGGWRGRTFHKETSVANGMIAYEYFTRFTVLLSPFHGEGWIGMGRETGVIPQTMTHLHTIVNLTHSIQHQNWHHIFPTCPQMPHKLYFYGMEAQEYGRVKRGVLAGRQPLILQIYVTKPSNLTSITKFWAMTIVGHGDL